MTSKRKEQRLGTFFDQVGTYVQRSGSSGSGHRTDVMEYPGPTDDRCQADILIAIDGQVYLIELKSGQPRLYVEADELRKLAWAASMFDGVPLVAARYDRDSSFYIYDPAPMQKTDSGNLALSPDFNDHLARLTDPGTSAEDPPGLSPEDVVDIGIHLVLAGDADA